MRETRSPEGSVPWPAPASRIVRHRSTPEATLASCSQRLRERRFRQALLDPPECTLAQLRRSLLLSQKEVAGRLGIGQIQVSRLERRTDLRVRTVVAYVSALGGTLELVVRVGRRAVRIRVGDQRP